MIFAVSSRFEARTPVEGACWRPVGRGFRSSQQGTGAGGLLDMTTAYDSV